MMQTRSLGLFLGVLGLFAFGEAQAQTQINGRVMVLVDTSGSMLYHFSDNATAGGDGNLSSSYRDGVAVTTPQNFYPGRPLGGGSYDGINSRLYAAKQVLSQVVNSTGNLDFGLMRYAVGTGGQFGSPTCADAKNCCAFTGTTGGACQCQPDYTDNSFSTNPVGISTCTLNTYGRITWQGGCGPKASNQATDGGQVLVTPGTNSSSSVLTWVDGVEDFRSGTGGFPSNGELRGSGPTPLAGSIRTALNSWYLPIKNISGTGCTAAGCDPQIDCRPYVFVLLTDGADSCEGCPSTTGCNQIQSCVNASVCTDGSGRGNGTCTGSQCACTQDYNCGSGYRCVNGRCYDARQLDNPVTVAQQLYNANPTNPVRTYVIGVAFVNGDPAIDTLNRTAVAGGTSYARIANNPSELQAAFADVVASSVRYETCNNRDDNCNGVIDEGFNKGGSCSTGVGACQRTGILKCDATGNGTQCCVNDGNPNSPCTPLQAGTPIAEICVNGVDDNCNGIIDSDCVCTPKPETCNNVDDDCDLVIDNNLIDAGQPCGTALGECTSGLTVCTNGVLSCQGGIQPATEICNNKDDDCDGVIDGISQSCYGGPANTMGVGICRGGQQQCTNGSYGACNGEVRPRTEVCNGQDDDCNGTTDDAPGTGASCCPSGLCPVGQCRAGVMQCAGTAIQCVGAVGPSQEICDGIDNDCNGRIDDVPGLGTTCSGPFSPDNGCPTGQLACDTQQQRVVCVQRTPSTELCDGQDNDCDGQIDEAADIAQNDTRLGQACSNVGQQNPRSPCKLGTSICRFGQVVCDGELRPTNEVCDFQDNDCDGTVDDNAPCPTNYECRRGYCVARCGPGEFPCPGGYVCDTDRYCYPISQCNPACEPGFTCRNRVCVDNCAGRTCRPYEVCNRLLNGSCEDNSCRTRPDKQCPAGQFCDYDVSTDNYICRQTPCDQVNCGTGQYCDPKTGNCQSACVTPCRANEHCVNGNCVEDPCFGKNCNAGQSCDPTTGQCTTDDCDGRTCPLPTYQACFDGVCQVSPCLAVKCPTGTECLVNPRGGSVTCAAPLPPPRDQVLGVGGGGFSCTVSGTRSSNGGGAMTMLGVVLLVLWSRRRAAGRRI
jgi:MYXO-CTERM domain-containing protein